MEESESLPIFKESERISSSPIRLAKYSSNGKLLAIVHTDFSLSIWDSEDILVNTYEQSFFETKSKNKSNSHHVVFLEWSASNRYLYLIVDTTGFKIDVYSPNKPYKNFTFESPLNSFSVHPVYDDICLVTVMDEVIELDIKNDKHAVIYNYHEEMKTDSSRKMNSYSYAEYTTIDNIIVLWLQSKLLLIQSNQVIKWVSLKTSQPLQQRIRIDNEKRLCMVACRNEIFLFSLPDLVIENTHRDTINDIPFKSIDYLSKEDMILALPDTYKFGAPVFYLYPSKHKVDSQDCRDLQHSLYWGILHPSGNSIFFCDNEGGIIIFRKEMKDFIWSGPMYPYRFTYLEKTEMGDDKVDESFESTYFPPNDIGYDLENCQGTHPIDLVRDAPPSFPLLTLDLQYGKEEYTVMKNVNQLPSAIEDIYSSGMN